jgi:hypothetical protein
MTNRSKNAGTAVGANADGSSSVLAGWPLWRSDDSQTRTCPDGQTPGLTRVNGDTFSQAKPPPGGGSITDSVSGSGVDYSVRSDRDSVTLSVHGPGSATFEVACR